MGDPKLHSRMPPSASQRTYNCPGWVGLAERTDAQGFESEAAELGTLAHHLAHVCLTSPPNAFYYTRHKLPPDEDYEGLDLKVTEEMAEHVQGYVDYVVNCQNAIRKHYGEVLFENYIEKRVKALRLHKDAHGTPDAVVGALFNELHIIDFKYGVAPVQAKENFQLLTYAGYAIEQYGDFDKISLHIYQPRIGRKDPVSRWTTNSRYVKDFLKRMIKKMKYADTSPDDYKDGPWCFFCPCKQNACPIMAEKKTDKAVEIFGEFIGEDDDDYNF